MRVSHPADGGLGDVLDQSFIVHLNRGNERVWGLSRMLSLWRSGRADVVGCSYHRNLPDNVEQGWNRNVPNPAVSQMFAALGLRMLDGPEKFSTYDGVGNLDGFDLSEWTISTTLQEPVKVEPTPLPTRKPDRAVPRDFILFNELASRADRCITDREIYRAIKNVSPLPIVKVGVGESHIDCDIDLTNKTRSPETFWLAQHARIIISAETFFRCFAHLFGKTVIEILDARRAVPDTILRNEMDRKIGAYGMTPELNHTFLWQSSSKAFSDFLSAVIPTGRSTTISASS